MSRTARWSPYHPGGNGPHRPVSVVFSSQLARGEPLDEAPRLAAISQYVAGLRLQPLAPGGVICYYEEESGCAWSDGSGSPSDSRHGIMHTHGRERRRHPRLGWMQPLALASQYTPGTVPVVVR